MLKTVGPTQRKIRQGVIVISLALAVAAAALTAPPARAEKGGQQGASGLTTGIVGIAAGQTARLAVWNKGQEPILVELRFVDEQGKVLIQCNDIVEAGKSMTEDWPCCGGVEPDQSGGPHRVELQAQFRTNASREIGLLVPTLQVIDDATGKTSWMIGQEGFVEFRLVPNPPIPLPW